MHTLWPDPASDDLTDQTLESVYAYPPDLDRAWVQVNFVSSLDGAVSVGGKSRGLSGPGDKRVFRMHRDLCDVILVGAGTALVERYRGVKATEVRAERRERLGLTPVPPIAVVTAKASVTPESLLLTDTIVPPIVVTCEAAPEDRRRALADAGADVIVAGDEDVDLAKGLAELSGRGLRRVDCEGGPRLFGQMLADNLVDQLCLTVSPMLTACDAGRITAGAMLSVPQRMRLHSVIRDEDFLMLAYRR